MPVAIIIPEPRFWPPELKNVPARRLADGRRVVASKEVAALLGCTTANLRKMAQAGTLLREQDLDEPRSSWYALEEVARAYFTRHPGAALDDEDETLRVRLWPELSAIPNAVPPSRPVENLEALEAAVLEQIADATIHELDEKEAEIDDKDAEIDDKDAEIARLTAALAEQQAEVKRLRAQLADPRRRNALQRHRLKE